MEPYRAAQEFFKFAFGRGNEGYVGLATLAPGIRTFREKFFEWPPELPKMVEFCMTEARTLNVYMCPQLLNSPRREKSNVKICPNVWADLDTCHPDELRVKPSVLVESSPDRWQALWVFEEPLPPAEAEALSRRIAYYHAHQGADRSGWDLTQLLRVPGTINFKYDTMPVVRLAGFERARYRPADLINRYPAVKTESKEELPLPAQEKLPSGSGEDLLQKYVKTLTPQADTLFLEEPDSDWSKALHHLEMLAIEADMSREEVFIFCRDSACNKFRRDSPDDLHRADHLLWRDVCRAWVRHEEAMTVVVPEDWEMPDLLTPTERRLIEGRRTFVEDYIDWAKSVGDAAPQYHEAGAFIILSSTLAGSIIMRALHDVIRPNLWFMILGDTTLTRKTTAMNLAKRLVREVDPDIELANDGSLEGIITALEGRPGQPSLFLRDEFAGLLEGMTKKDFMAGLSEMFANLYDGESYKRVLRKEEINVKDPIFIIFAGGIKTKITTLLTEDLIVSGFTPRFVFLTAEADISRRKSMRPATVTTDGERNELRDRLKKIREHYHAIRRNVAYVDKVTKKMVIPSETVPQYELKMADAVWDRYDQLELDMISAAKAQPEAETLLMPSYLRLCVSTFKAAMLIAASEMRNPPEEGVEILMEDLLMATHYLEGWRLHTNTVIRQAGKSVDERKLDRVYNSIVRKPGITRSSLMQSHQIQKFQANNIFATLEERGLIVAQQKGRGTVYTAAAKVKRQHRPPGSASDEPKRITVKMPEEVS